MVTVMKKICFFLVACASLPLLTVAQSRNVDWIPGLGGSASTWTTVANAYAGDGQNPGLRDIPTSRRSGFNTTNGIPAFASDVRDVTGGANTIAIGHSLGGTAIRQIDLWNSNHWSGGITVGSPLAEARIALSPQNGLGQQFFNGSIVELIRGPAAGSIALQILAPPVGILIDQVAHYGTLYSNNIASVIVNSISNSLGMTPATAADLDPAGGYMQGIANQNTNTPKINVWGNEDNPVLWRLAGSFAEKPDQWGIDLANRAAGIYTTAADIEYVTSWISPFIFAHGYYNWRGHQWMAGANWLRNTANPAWQTIIGAAYYESAIVPQWEYDFDTCGGVAQLCADPNDPNCDDSRCFRWVDRQVNVYRVEQSDGVVPASSQRNDGRAWRGHIVEAPGINHMEMREYDRIRPTFNSIFDGDNIGNQRVFRIGPRP